MQVLLLAVVILKQLIAFFPQVIHTPGPHQRILNVCVLPAHFNSYVEILILRMIVFGGGGIWMVARS